MALTLRYLDGLSVPEAGPALDRSVHATETLLVAPAPRCARLPGRGRPCRVDRWRCCASGRPDRAAAGSPPRCCAASGASRAGRAPGATVRYFVDDMDRAVGSTATRWASRRSCARPRVRDALPGRPAAAAEPADRAARAARRHAARARGLQPDVAPGGRPGLDRGRARGQGATLATPITAGPTVNTVLVATRRQPRRALRARGEGYHERPSGGTTHPRRRDET